MFFVFTIFAPQKKKHMLKEYLVWNNSLLDWIISLAIIVGGFLVGKLIYFISSKFLSKITAKTKTKIDDILLEQFKSPFIFGVMLGSIWGALVRLELPEKMDVAIGNIYTILVVINITWAVSRLVGTIVREYLVPYAQREDSKVDTHMSSILQRTFNYVIWGIGIVLALHNVGVEVGTLLAGLGIGGVAFALAAQDTIKNLFGGITLFVDRPFRIGDRIKIDNVDGFVMDIGLRSLRIKTLDNRMITIPNYKVVDSTLENVTSEPNRRVMTTLGLTYDTTPEKLELSMTILRNIPTAISDICKDVDVCFTEYGDFSLQVLFIYYIKKDKDIYKTRSKVNMEILRQFNANGLEFAFPTQTLYVKQ